MADGYSRAGGGIGTALLVLQGLVKLLEDIAVAFNLDYYTPQESESEGDLL